MYIVATYLLNTLSCVLPKFLTLRRSIISFLICLLYTDDISAGDGRQKADVVGGDAAAEQEAKC